MDLKADIAESTTTDLKLGLMISQVLIDPNSYRYVGDTSGFKTDRKPVIADNTAIILKVGHHNILILRIAFYNLSVTSFVFTKI